MGDAGVAHRFGQNLRSARRRAGVSQEEVAFRSGLHGTEVGLLERGERTPRLDTVVRLAGALSVKLDCELLRGLDWTPGSVQRGSFSLPAGPGPGGREGAS